MDKELKKSSAATMVRLLDKVLQKNANATSSIWYFEKKQPSEIKRFKKYS
ncbi:MAG: hypothetical protein J6A82_01300 [Coprococcus sp.]|nr:hypothetical protein [Coprococcus sp.]